MEENIKNRIILILAIFILILFIGSISSCNNTFRHRAARDKEMAARLDLEEKLNKSLQEKTVLDEKIKSIEAQAQEEKTVHQVTKKALLQEQLVNQSLKEELVKVTKLKEALEEDLKEALVEVKSGKNKK